MNLRRLHSSVPFRSFAQGFAHSKLLSPPFFWEGFAIISLSCTPLSEFVSFPICLVSLFKRSLDVSFKVLLIRNYLCITVTEICFYIYLVRLYPSFSTVSFLIYLASLFKCSLSMSHSRFRSYEASIYIIFFYWDQHLYLCLVLLNPCFSVVSLPVGILRFYLGVSF